MEINCLECGTSLSEYRQMKQAKFCSEECKQKRNVKRYHTSNPKSGLATPTVGAISELKVAVDLLNRGYAVFRAMSPSCACDLAILMKDRLLRVEVKTGQIGLSGKLYKTTLDHSKFDVLATVLPGEILYEPPL